jgi:hypothetical protein
MAIREVPAVSRAVREIVGLIGFVVYSGGLVAFVNGPSGWPRLVAALVGGAGILVAVRAWRGMDVRSNG